MQKDKNDKLNDILNSLKDKTDEKSAEDYLLGQLNPQQSAFLKKLMNDDDAVKEFLSSEQAKKLLKQLMKDKE